MRGGLLDRRHFAHSSAFFMTTLRSRSVGFNEGKIVDLPRPATELVEAHSKGQAPADPAPWAGTIKVVPCPP